MLLDQFQRPLRNLRLSVTDRCNLRCRYCMPELDYVWLPREDLLHFEEINRLVDVFMSLGVNHIRLTGGEPLLRRDLSTLVDMIAGKEGLNDLALTSNGILLADQIDELQAAGLRRVTVSLDTLRHDRFAKLARFDELTRVRRGIEAAARVFGGLKLDTVVIRGVNDDELVELIEYGKTVNAEVRFIEYMDVGGATNWSWSDVVSREGHARAPGPALRRRRGDRRTFVSARGSLPAAGRHRLRHHLVHDRPLLRVVRSQPAHGRRHVVPLPLRDAWHRPARCVARRREHRRVEGDYRVGLVGTDRPWRGVSAGTGRTAGVCSALDAEEEPAPRDAHPRRVGRTRTGRAVRSREPSGSPFGPT